MAVFVSGLSSRKWKMFSIGVLTVLVLTGFAVGPSVASSPVHGPATGPTSGVASKLPVHSPTFVGPAKHAIVGPFKTTAAGVASGLASHSTGAVVNHPLKSAVAIPSPHQSAATIAAPLVNPQPIPTPSVSCQPGSSACDKVSTSSGGATGVAGLNAIDSSGLYGITIEPSDQGVCAGDGFVVETDNIGELRVYSSTLQQASSDIPLDSVMGLGNVPASMGGPWSSGGDVSCLFDYDNGGHWFITEIVSNSSWAVGGPFGGCFAGKAFGCWEGIAVSVSANPLGAYNVYYVNANYNPAEGGYPYLLNDFAKIGNTRDAFLMFYDEFPLFGGGISPGGGFFNGAQEFAIDKKALELGFPVITPAGGANPYFTVAIENMGFLASPDGTCAATGACWYQVIPAASPDPTQYDNSHGGSGFMLAPLDFFGLGDTRIAAFDWTGLSNLNSYNCARCSSIQFGGTLFSGVLGYIEEGQLASQKAGPIPLGDNCVAFGLNATGVPVTSCPENGIATNGDGFTQASYAGGQIWGALSTLVSQTYSGGEDGTPSAETHVGAVYWVIGTHQFDTSGLLTITSQSYVTAMHEDLEFPAMAAGGTEAQDGGNGQAIITFDLSGNGGPTGADHGGFYPSTAYGRVTSTSNGLLSHVIHIADLGQSPQDGFTEYQGYPNGERARWGDYNAAVFVPFSDGTVVFATQYIQAPNCSDSDFLVDPSCGGTRDPFANWGTSVNSATA